MAAERFLLNVPDLWEKLDLGGARFAAVRAEALARTRDPRERIRINDAFRQAREVARAARRQGALLATGTATAYDDGLFLAYGMVFAVTTPAGQELTLPVLSRSLGTAGARGVPKDQVVSAVRLPHVGTVARVTATETTRLTAGADVKLLTMHTMMPVPGRDRDYLVVTLASPNLPLKAEVHDLFDAVTSTFRFLTETGDQVPPAAA